MSYPIKGTCQCGQVSYLLHKAPKIVMACHCKECQILSSSPFSVTAMIATNSIDFSGTLKEWSRIAESGNENIAKFCPDCGNRVYHYNPKEPDTIKLKLKSNQLGDSVLLEPTVHVWVREKQDWYKVPKNVKSFEKQPL